MLIVLITDTYFLNKISYPINFAYSFAFQYIFDLYYVQFSILQIVMQHNFDRFKLFKPYKSRLSGGRVKGPLFIKSTVLRTTYVGRCTTYVGGPSVINVLLNKCVKLISSFYVLKSFRKKVNSLLFSFLKVYLKLPLL